MRLVEKHIISQQHKYYAIIDETAFASKNVYNTANYIIRQKLIAGDGYTNLGELYHEVKKTEAYISLPRKVSNDVLRQVMRDWKSFKEAKKVYEKEPKKFLGKPKLPKYKHKTEGRNLVVYDKQAISKKSLREGIVKLSGLNIEIKTKQEEVDQVRIIPKRTHYVVEVVYTKEPEKNLLEEELLAGIDVGLNNLAAVVSNKKGFQPIIVNGKPLKETNQFYNKRKAELQTRLQDDRKSSKQIERITDKRTRQIENYLHTASKYIVNQVVKENIGTIVIGKSDDWKQEINLGRRNNQNFVQVPHARFVDMLKYKAEMVGIKVITTEESYTSKTSFLDGEEPIKQESYKGKRVKRGLFSASDGKLINADLNGAYQIIKKVFPNAFVEGIEGIAVCPLRWTCPCAQN